MNKQEISSLRKLIKSTYNKDQNEPEESYKDKLIKAGYMLHPGQMASDRIEKLRKFLKYFIPIAAIVALYVLGICFLGFWISTKVLLAIIFVIGGLLGLIALLAWVYGNDADYSGFY